MPFDTKPNTCSLGARITRTVPIQWSSVGGSSLSRQGVSSMTSSLKKKVPGKLMLLRVGELMHMRAMPMLKSSKRLSNERQRESMLWRASPEMVTPRMVSCLSSGKCRDGAGKSEMVTMYMLSCLRCGKFKNCVDKSGKLQQLKLATPSVGAKRSADNGSGNIMYSSPS